MDDHAARRLRMRGQRLEPREAGGAVAVARAVCGLQAQDLRAAWLSVRVRSEGLTAADVDAAAAPGPGSPAAAAPWPGSAALAAAPGAVAGLVRTWAWRRTLHLLPAEDVPWVLSLVAPGALRGVGARWRALGLDDGVYARAREVLAANLRDGPRTRAELRERLRGEGIDASGQRLPHLVSRAALEGVLQAGPGAAFSALHLPPPPPRGEALATLARRYLDAYAPAEPRDLAAWSGLPAADVRAAWAAVADELTEVEVAGRRAWTLGEPAVPPAPEAPVVRLLPAFDTHLLGHRGRDLTVAPAHARDVWPGGGWLHPVVLVDGRAVATWRLQGDRLTVHPFAPLPVAARAGLRSEAADVGRFLGAPVELRLQTDGDDAG